MSTCCCVPLGFLAAANVSAGGGGGGGGGTSVTFSGGSLFASSGVSIASTGNSFSTTIAAGPGKFHLFNVHLVAPLVSSGFIPSGINYLSQATGFTATLDGNTLTQSKFEARQGPNLSGQTCWGTMYREDASISGNVTLSVSVFGNGDFSGCADPCQMCVVYGNFTGLTLTGASARSDTATNGSGGVPQIINAGATVNAGAGIWSFISLSSATTFTATTSDAGNSIGNAVNVVAANSNRNFTVGGTYVPFFFESSAGTQMNVSGATAGRGVFSAYLLPRKL